MEKYSIVDQDEAKSDKVKLKEALAEMIAERMLEECSLPEEEKDEALKGPVLSKTVTKCGKFRIHGLIIGSKIKNMEVAVEFYDKKKLVNRKLHHFEKK